MVSGKTILKQITVLMREALDVSVRTLPVVRTHNQKKKKQLLLVRLDAIGDFILFLDTFKEYRKLYPPEEWEITLLGNQIWFDLAENLSYADHYWFMEHKPFLRNSIYRYSLLRQVRNASFDVVIQPTFSRKYEYGDVVVRVSRAPERIGYEGDCSDITPYQKRRSDRWYTHLISASSEPLMELERNAEFVRGLGLSDFQADVPKLVIPDEAQQRADELIAEVVSRLSHFTDFYIFFPGASWVGRQWPAEQFAELAKRVYDKEGWAGVICGGPGEEVLAERLLAQTSGTPLVNLAGKTRLIELAGVIKRAKILISNETSAIHLAAAVGTPSVCILGGGHYRRFLPYSFRLRENVNELMHESDREFKDHTFPITVIHPMNCFGCGWKCIYDVASNAAVPCIANISVDSVMGKIVSLV